MTVRTVAIVQARMGSTRFRTSKQPVCAHRIVSSKRLSQVTLQVFWPLVDPAITHAQ